ncbi:MAG: bifunctional methylenetetrahydrofolate dehydrogenase/methenyltetrahydrofolate cyclohydrolase FolD [Gemmatimonadetes bacterium]|uniref:Bifunctional protein FolD n=1 Tax=Candidatus Kutchimonas denitrificans TaxID=3056748 RepID=A0AAE5C849_9BACT|nr:bifunctional methylenetetrahydrofolate dehydrogenase/methenyltetrahydrofolate cyclohydrolase FolD [Gemmatimonadota bacterium]NIR74176.1 bifunctional methylenetetrahydrofolate dehydrogenase/methenyltetrahydrofolate cyclohydrolase FolD [Candidatus Kutchimonas denitrificans]NIR99798.1 bifunctional methylenetetrahydrofolate dehydrogenase/methenyltetrahydrofolate cyclohydrolase FolD [Gemmatimonadota bacterium]NIT65387.1 bifunctional methylenetetrahydrofolate dehydrogenase/methenyltetrahydrofolate 
MAADIIDGKKIAADIRGEVKEQVEELLEQGDVRPGLSVVLVGDNPASAVYVRMKAKACEETGIKSEVIKMEKETTQQELEDVIDRLNADPSVHGILVQLPLPEQIVERDIIMRIAPEKDVDGFHPVNVGRMVIGDPSAFRPATPAGVVEMLMRTGHDPSGKRVVIVGRSNIVGKPLAVLLMQKMKGGNATVTVAHSRTQDLAAVMREADILVAAIGAAEFVKGDNVKPGAVVIDVGVNRLDDASTEKGYRLVGDVAYDEAAEVAAAITPVPGGVGPMTIAMLLTNCIKAAREISGIS